MAKPSISSNEHVEIVKESNGDIPPSTRLAFADKDEILVAAERFVATFDLGEHADAIRKGALIAWRPDAFEILEELDENDRSILQTEKNHRWRQPVALYRMIIICSIAAAVNGMDLVSINGANIFFPTQFGIDKGGRDTWLVGLVNSAPYITCALFSVWLNEPLNRWIGRRGVLFLSGCVCFTASIWAACTNTWWHLAIARAWLGVGIGPKSATLSVYAAEVAPANIRGALTMCWQIWVAFGIMMGTACNIAFYKVPDASGIEGLNWRLMVGVAGVPALILLFQVYTNPESPRWLMLKGRYNKAFQSLRILRGSDVQAARDLFYIHLMLEEEAESETHQSATKFVRMFTARRNLNAVIGSSIVMFAQQFCGINIISYYSTTIFTETGASQVHSLLASWGFGMLNFLFALPAVHMIDRFGRRSLLLWTFPFMTLFLLVAAGGFYVEDSTSKLAVVALGIYFYVVFYSPGEGPVPFVYSAEAFPLAIRDLGMSWAVFICWFFNALIGLTFPSIIDSFTAPGAFFWYAGWNALLYVIIYFFVPETKSLTLEELDQVFDVPLGQHALFYLREIPKNLRRIVLREDIPAASFYNSQTGI